MPVSNNRLLLELEKYRREINREIINPQFPELSLNDLKPLLTMVAHARAAYVRELLDIANVSSTGVPSPDQIKQLKTCRETFDELVTATNALETVIQRDYLDVKSSSPHGD
ncbi:hypothetical protein [Marinobacterium mangrovicola]|uniref:Uncharacterized protein n=1 Tax=Marinobacterium mangrovicola TaxID=1476959 RepID=A0A4R1GJ01_9GAMM|nr:hypothetical protein [Marinobacterium mangrovicola]TCK05919.1 hypothetical protein CLV83_2860 [Marinobacterium mangrovicola]